MEWFFFWVMLSVVVGVAAHYRRGRFGFGWFLLSLLISPLIAGLFLCIARDLKREQEQKAVLQNSRKCPRCAELVKREALACRFCGHDLEPLPVPVPVVRPKPAMF
jgi:hypothetical protein